MNTTEEDEWHIKEKALRKELDLALKKLKHEWLHASHECETPILAASSKVVILIEAMREHGCYSDTIAKSIMEIMIGPRTYAT